MSRSGSSAGDAPFYHSESDFEHPVFCQVSAILRVLADYQHHPDPGQVRALAWPTATCSQSIPAAVREWAG